MFSLKIQTPKIIAEGDGTPYLLYNSDPGGDSITAHIDSSKGHFPSDQNTSVTKTALIWGHF